MASQLIHTWVKVLTGILAATLLVACVNDWVSNMMRITKISLPSSARVGEVVTVGADYLGAESGAKLHFLGLAPTSEPVKKFPVPGVSASGEYIVNVLVSFETRNYPDTRTYSQPGFATVSFIPMATGTWVVQGMNPYQPGPTAFATASVLVEP